MDGTERSTRSWHGTGEASSTPELTATSTPAQTFESDWHQFGGLLAQVFSGVGQDIATNPAKLVDRSPDRRLGGAEVLADSDRKAFGLQGSRLPCAAGRAARRLTDRGACDAGKNGAEGADRPAKVAEKMWAARSAV